MSFERKAKRRPWTQEEKSAALKSCASKCACCGRKLNMKTLTMEHVIPISRGGENKLENLVVLCQSCNSTKGNKFFWPLGYYMALNDRGKLNTINAYVNKWVDENIDREYFEQYPMIAESIAFFVKPNNKMAYNFKNGAYLPQLIIDMTELNNENCSKYLTQAGISKRMMFRSLQDEHSTFSLIACTKRSDESLLGLFTLQVQDDNLFINEVWSNSDRICRMLIQGLLYTLSPIWAKYDADIVIVRTRREKPIKELFDCYEKGILPMPLKYLANPNELFDYKGKSSSNYKENQMLYKFFNEEHLDISRCINDLKKDISKNLKGDYYE